MRVSVLFCALFLSESVLSLYIPAQKYAVVKRAAESEAEPLPLTVPKVKRSYSGKSRKLRKARKARKSRKDSASSYYSSDGEGNAYESDDYEGDDGSSSGDFSAVASDGETASGTYSEDDNGSSYDLTYDDGQGNTYEEYGYASKARKSRKDSASSYYSSDGEGDSYASDSYESDNGSSSGDFSVSDSDGSVRLC
ncbi:unnamed protein product [Ambrosiozyma monospora]|uniref:Unnamed protein product n=1 Tax=Ambrosiozyma monospora TaxID=43982 RepID=A0A9W6WIK8_AMBMO|nr:unnamed protein product [Ambrosiozyma monospora]